MRLRVVHLRTCWVGRYYLSSLFQWQDTQCLNKEKVVQEHSGLPGVHAQLCPTFCNPHGLQRVTGRKAQGSPNRGNRLQASDIFYLSLKRQEETNSKCQIFFFPSPYKIKRRFSMEMFFLNCVNETMCLLWNLPFFKMVPPKTDFFFSQALG